MIRIAYLIDNLDGPTGGTEKHLLMALAGLDRQRFEPSLFTLRSSPWFEESELQVPGECLGFRSFKGLDLVACGKRFVSFCRENEVDIVQTFFRDANIAGTLWARKAGVPVVIASRRNIGTGYWHTGLEVALLRYLKRHTSHYIANSRAAAEDAIRVERMPSERVSVLPNCLDPSKHASSDPETVRKIRTAWGIPSDSVVIGAVANLRPVKNLPFLIRAARKVIDVHPEVRFVILGEGEQRPELENMIRSLDLESHVKLPGRSHQVALDLTAFDIGALCSTSESSPNAVLEYMAAGKPSVVIDVGGNRELIRSGENGFLFAPGDDGAFAHRAGELASDRQLREELGAAARGQAQREHDCRQILPRLEGIYTALVEGNLQRLPIGR